MPPFDPVRWTVYLLGLVVLAYLVIAVGSVAMCWRYADAIVAGQFICDARDRIGEGLALLLATLVALVSSLMRGPSKEP